jgi:uncharacterized membrane protein
MNVLLIVVQWLHVITAVIWFGTTLFLDLILIPTLTTFPISQQREFNARLIPNMVRIVAPTALAVVILGLLRGTVFGPVRSFEFLVGTAYGWTFLIALLLAVATILWGQFVTGRNAEKLAVIPVGDDGQPGPDYVAQSNLVKRVAWVELGLFLLVFTTMILMRFGYWRPPPLPQAASDSLCAPHAGLY